MQLRLQVVSKSGLVGSPAESWLLYDPYGLLSSSSCHMSPYDTLGPKCEADVRGQVEGKVT